MNNIKLYKLKYFGVEPGEGRSVCYPRLILKGNTILFLTWGIPTADGICIGLYMACIDLFWILYQELSNLFKIKSSSSIWIPYHIIYVLLRYCGVNSLCLHEMNYTLDTIQKGNFVTIDMVSFKSNNVCFILFIHSFIHVQNVN